MSQVIELKPGVDFFPSKRERRVDRKRSRSTVDRSATRRTLANGGVGKRMPVTIDLTAIIEAIPHPLVRGLVKLTAEELMRVRS